jgi:hypothetical protein
MGLEPIEVELNDFAKLELLRDEDERLAQELADVEREIRGQKLSQIRQDYLASLSQYYAANPVHSLDPARLQELDGRRAMIHSTLEAVRAQRQQFESSLGTPERQHGSARRGPSAGVPGSKSTGFDSFENFRQSRGQ